MDDKNNFAILALVAIVAVVGLVVLFSGGKQATSVASLPSAEEEANIGGQVNYVECKGMCEEFTETGGGLRSCISFCASRAG